MSLFDRLFITSSIWKFNLFQCQNWELSLNHVHKSEWPLCSYTTSFLTAGVCLMYCTEGKASASVWPSCFIVCLYLNIKVTYMLYKAEQSLNPDFISRERFRLNARGVSSVRRRNNCWAKNTCLSCYSQQNHVVCCSFLFYSILLRVECGGRSYGKIRSSTSDKSLWGQRSSCSLL